MICKLYIPFKLGINCNFKNIYTSITTKESIGGLDGILKHKSGRIPPYLTSKKENPLQHSHHLKNKALFPMHDISN